MRCEEFSESMIAHLYGERVPGFERFKEHLRDCPFCQGEIDQISQLRGLLEGERLVKAPSWIWERLSTTLEKRQTKGSGHLIPVAAAILFIFLFALPWIGYLDRDTFEPVSLGEAPLESLPPSQIEQLIWEIDEALSSSMYLEKDSYFDREIEYIGYSLEELFAPEEDVGGERRFEDAL
jgi:hypothetical protein